MTNMDTTQKAIVITDDSGAKPLNRSTMNSGIFANLIPVTNNDRRGFTGIFKILIRITYG